MRLMKVLAAVLLVCSMARAQNPATHLNPQFQVNAGTANGIAAGYAPTFSATGLTLNIGAGTANCNGTLVTYAGGTLSMSNNTTNYVYLNANSACIPAVTTSTLNNIQAPLFIVVTSGGNITAASFVDNRLALFSGWLPCAPTTPNGVPFVVTETLSGGALQPLICSLPGLNSRNITGTTSTDTIVTADGAPGRLDYKGSVAVAVTLPTATTLGVAKFTFVAVNNTTGSSTAVTITPTTWSVDRGQGAGPVSTLVIAQHSKCVVSVDAAGGQWDADCNTIN